LEARGLSLATVLLRLFKPIIEQALNANLKKIEDISAALAAADDWLLTYPPAGGRPFSSSASLGSPMASQPKLSSSANRFNSMIQVTNSAFLYKIFSFTNGKLLESFLASSFFLLHNPDDCCHIRY
jgi:hypothetical protein